MSTCAGDAKSDRVIPRRLPLTKTVSSSFATSSPSSSAPTGTDLFWQRRTAAAQKQLLHLADLYAQKAQENEEVLDAIEDMIATHELALAAVTAGIECNTRQHHAALAELRRREAEALSEKQRAVEEISALRDRGARLVQERERIQEDIVMHSDAVEQLQRALEAQRQVTAEEERKLDDVLERERVMQDATHGLFGEVKEMVVELEQIRRAKANAEQTAKEMEILRRQLYSQCEELKGTIRVYCRVKGGGGGGGGRNSNNSIRGETLRSSEPLRETSISSRSTVSLSTEALYGRTAAEGKCGGGKKKKMQGGPPTTQQGWFVFPQLGEEVQKTLCVCQSRSNATSTGTQESREKFTYDRVFDGNASQEDVYADVEPLVNCAIDGYRVCIFAYGQTGSGKTYSMEGDVWDEKGCGITPRALRTIFSRQEELKKDGWKYNLSCYFIEIYNDVIRDLQQDPSVYEPGGAAALHSNYHVIKHHNESGSTSITNVVEKPVCSLEDFQRQYRAAMKNRSTAKTQINDRSSRSHCVFVLRIEGDNAGIRQRSQGTLCLVDLAGSERVNNAGTAQGQQFTEAVNINRSLLDLGKCISALNNSGSVAPWRNCKLTYLLQNYLGTKGGKMLMLVTVSDKDEHMAESLNSLRFASRVNQTALGPSVKRINNY